MTSKFTRQLLFWEAKIFVWSKLFRFEKILRNDETIRWPPESFRIPTYLLSGPQVIRKEIQQQKCKDLETPPEGPNTAFIERLRPLSRPKLLWKLFQTFREDWVQYSRFSDYLKAARKPMSDVWGSRSPAKGPERSQQEGWFFAGNREATNAEFGDSWSLPPVFRLVLLGSCSNVPCCLTELTFYNRVKTLTEI